MGGLKNWAILMDVMCVSSLILNSVFPDKLKLGDVTALSKMYEKLLYEHLNSFFETKLCPHFCGLCLRYRK